MPKNYKSTEPKKIRLHTNESPQTHLANENTEGKTMGSYTCAGYSRLSTGIAGERTGGTRQHTMQTAQSLEEQANMFLSVADATTEEGSFAASTVEVGNM